jgi:outer membrane protein
MKKILITIVSAFLVTITKGQKKDISLAEALSLASSQNRQLQISYAENKKAEAVINENLSFRKLSVNATASYSLFAEKPVIFMKNEAATNKVSDVKVGGTNAFIAGIVASYPLIQPYLKERINVSSIASQIQRQRTEQRRSYLLMETGKLYYTIQFYRNQIRLFHQSQERNEKALKDSRSLFLQGKGLKSDTLKNFINVQNTRSAISELVNQTKIATLDLLQLMGLNEGTEIELTDDLTQLNQDLYFSIDSLKIIAWNNRPEVKEVELQKEFNKSELKLASSEFKPQLHAVAQYQVQAQSDKFSIWNYNLPRTSFIGLQLNVPLYSGNRLKHKTSRINYSLHQQKLASEDLRSTINREIETHAAALSEAYFQRDIQQKNVEAAEVNYYMQQERYRHGLGTRLELTDAELALTQARIFHLQSIYRIRIIELEIKKATGSI